MVASPTMHRWKMSCTSSPVPALAGEARRRSHAASVQKANGAPKRNGVTLGLGLRERHDVDPASRAT